MVACMVGKVFMGFFLAAGKTGFKRREGVRQWSCATAAFEICFPSAYICKPRCHGRASRPYLSSGDR
jgi:hypothetical protein